jgi:hypothetical protein
MITNCQRCGRENASEYKCFYKDDTDSPVEDKIRPDSFILCDVCVKSILTYLLDTSCLKTNIYHTVKYLIIKGD